MKLCPQVFNLEIFKKSLLLRNMIIDDNSGEEIDFDRSSREKLFESIKKDKDIFERKFFCGVVIEIFSGKFTR